MKIIFVGAYYYIGPIRHLYRIFEIYKALGDIFRAIGITTKYFVKHNEIIPLHNTIKEEDLDKELRDCDLLFIWNGGLSQGKEITDKCRALGIPVYFSELGWLPQNGTFYFDKKGVNYESSLLDWEYRPLNSREEVFLNTQQAYYHRFLAKKTGLKEPEEFIFVPLQDERDSQIKLFSPCIKTMQQLVDYVCAHVPGRIIFKTHPKFSPGELKIPENCKLYNTGTTHDFLPEAKYIITINSTVGIEALSYFKPVIVLGNAFYEGRGITYKAENDHQFKAAIEWATQGKTSLGIIESFLFYLFNKQWYLSFLKDPNRVLSLIENITDIR